MPSSLDQRLSRLHLHLADRVSARELRRLGWHDFRFLEELPNLSVTELAAHALLYLTLDEQGRWTDQRAVLGGVLAFLSEEYGYLPKEGQAGELKVLLSRQVVNRQAVVDWFMVVYPV